MSYKYFSNTTYFITYKTVLGKMYFNDNHIKQIIVEQIFRALDRYNWKLYSYAIMSNHYHLLINCPKKNEMGKVLQMINGGSSFRIKKECNISKSFCCAQPFVLPVINEDSFLKVLVYIIGNPIKHGLVSDLKGLRKYNFCNYEEILAEYGHDYIESLILLYQKFDFENKKNWYKFMKSYQE